MAERYAETAHFVPALGAAVLEWLDPRPGERILDLGCGDGALTEKIVAAGAEVVAVDATPDMVAAARARGIDAWVMPGQGLAFDREFDAVFSNVALHWMRPPEAVLAGVHRALKPGGRFVAEMGGHNNTAAIMVALAAVVMRRSLDAQKLNPWYFPSDTAYRKKLEAAGFAVAEIGIFPRPTVLTSGIAAWLDNFTDDFFAPLPETDRAAARGEVIDLLRPVLVDEIGTWIAPALPRHAGCLNRIFVTPADGAAHKIFHDGTTCSRERCPHALSATHAKRRALTRGATMGGKRRGEAPAASLGSCGETARALLPARAKTAVLMSRVSPHLWACDTGRCNRCAPGLRP